MREGAATWRIAVSLAGASHRWLGNGEEKTSGFDSNRAITSGDGIGLAPRDGMPSPIPGMDIIVKSAAVFAVDASSKGAWHLALYPRSQDLILKCMHHRDPRAGSGGGDG